MVGHKPGEFAPQGHYSQAATRNPAERCRKHGSQSSRIVRIPPQKVLLIMDEVRGKKVEEAIRMLTFSPQKGAHLLRKLINSAVANAEANKELDVDTLFIKKIFADQGPMMKRFLPRAMGRATRIRKRMSHLTVILDEH
jgi:large subunit ribosomal protein L22